MTPSRKRKLRVAAARRSGLTRRNLIRQAGLLGVGAIGAGVVGCKNRPDQDLADLSTEPTLVQAGGTISGRLRGLLTGVGAGFVTLRVTGFGQVATDREGRFSFRIEERGEYEVQISGNDFFRRVSRLLVNGSSSVDARLLESDAGLSMPFLNEFARGAGPTREGVVPRTPGATNRWQTVPQVLFYRGLEDVAKGVVPDARMTAMQAAFGALFAPLTGNTLGGAPVMEVRAGAPPADLGDVPADAIVVAQRRGGGLAAVHAGATSNPHAIVKARISCAVDSPIELFNRMVAHSLGGWVVSDAAPSVLNPGGRATASDRDLQAATFLYNRAPGSEAPDVDPPGVFLNT